MEQYVIRGGNRLSGEVEIGGAKNAALAILAAAVMADEVEKPEKITVMAEVAEWPEEIDVNRAKEAEARAQRRIQAHDPSINMSRAELALKRALVRLELGEK